MSSSSCPFNHNFHGWISQQHRDLDELVRARAEEPLNLERFQALAEKNIAHFTEYNTARSFLSRGDSLLSFSTLWCSNFENSFFWMGGCRPSLSVQLLHTMIGTELEIDLDEFIDEEFIDEDDEIRQKKVWHISGQHLMDIDDLRLRTVRQEDEITARLANLQESFSEDVFFEEQDSPDKKDGHGQGQDNENGAPNPHPVDNPIMKMHIKALTEILEDADMLRLKTVKDLLGILNPLQCVEFLVAAKKLYLSMRELGQKKYEDEGKFRGNN